MGHVFGVRPLAFVALALLVLLGLSAPSRSASQPAAQASAVQVAAQPGGSPAVPPPTGPPGALPQDGPSSFLEDEIEWMIPPEKPGAEEKPALWPFNPDDSSRVLGTSVEQPSDKARDALAFWTWAIQEFTTQRRSLASLNEQQDFLLDQLAQIRGLLSDESLSLPEIERRAQIRELFVKAQENEEQIEQEQAGMKDLCTQTAGRAAEIRKRLAAVREALERLGPPSATPRAGRDSTRKPPPAGGKPDPSDHMDPQRFYQYRQQIDDAIGLLEQVEKAPADGAGLLMSNMRKFRAYRSRQSDGTPLVARFDEQIQRLERSQKILQWRLAANDREIKDLRDLLGKMIQRMQAMQQQQQPTLEHAGAPTAPSAAPDPAIAPAAAKEPVKEPAK